MFYIFNLPHNSLTRENLPKFFVVVNANLFIQRFYSPNLFSGHKNYLFSKPFIPFQALISCAPKQIRKVYITIYLV